MGDDEVLAAAVLAAIGRVARDEDRQADGAFNSKSSASSLATKYGILNLCGNTEADLEQQQAQHDVIGGTFLRMRGFNETVPHLVEGHVLAKRYLCWKEPDYHGKLNATSKRTLVFQGGPMNGEEAAILL